MNGQRGSTATCASGRGRGPWAVSALLMMGLVFQNLASGSQSVSAGIEGTSLDEIPGIGVETWYTDDTTIRNLAASGARLVRIPLNWSAIEPTNTDPTHYSYSIYDSIFRRFAANGLSALVRIQGCPAWACASSEGPFYAGREADFAEFTGALAGRWGQPLYAVHYWELWNEPDGTLGAGGQLGWGLHPDLYAAMLGAAYPAIKGADSRAAVMSGGVAFDGWFTQGGTFNPDFLTGVLDNGGGSYLDAIAFHYYRHNGHGWTEIGTTAAALRANMAGHPLGDTLPLICTEAGLTSDPLFGSSEAEQARYVVRMNVGGQAARLMGQIWYLFRDYDDTRPGQQIYIKSGLSRLDNTLKPAYTAMQTLGTEIGSRGRFLRELGPEDGLSATMRGYNFRRASTGLRVTVLWNEGAAAEPFNISTALVPDVARVVDLYGAVSAPTPQPDGSQSVYIGADPVYIEWRHRHEDVPSQTWSYPYVEYLSAGGVVSGFSDGRFGPNALADRRTLTKMATVAMGWPITTAGGPHFVDVPTSEEYYAFIETAYAHGIIGGYPCGSPGEPCPGVYFRPEAGLNRGQIAKMVVLSKGWALIRPPVPSFVDVDPGSNFYSYVETAHSRDVLGGYPDGTFRTWNVATRAQLSKMYAVAVQQP